MTLMHCCAVARHCAVALCCAVALSFAIPAFAQIPPLIRYQGTLTDSSGAALDGSYDLTFRFYDAETGGAPMWEETQPAVPVQKGSFSVLLGSVAPLALRFDVDSWLAVAVNGGAELSPRHRVASVPNAYLADRAEKLDRSETIQPVNLARNGSFERWPGGSTPMPADWVLSGYGAAVSKNSADLRFDKAALNLTNGPGNAALLSQTLCTMSPSQNPHLRGQTVTASVWAKAGYPDEVRLEIEDGVGASASPWHPGDGAWRLLTVSRTLDAAATQLKVVLRAQGLAVHTAAFDGATVVEGPMPFAHHPSLSDANPSIGARVCHSAHQSIPSAGLVPLSFNTKRYDTDGCQDPSSGNTKLFCRTAGRYLIVGHVRWYNTKAGTRMIWIRLNGSTYIASQTLDCSSWGADQGMTVTALYPLQEGDYVELIAYHWGSGLEALSVFAWPNHSPELMMERLS